MIASFKSSLISLISFHLCFLLDCGLTDLYNACKFFAVKLPLLLLYNVKRLCSVSYAYGLYIDQEIKGVVTYGMSPSATLAESIAGEKYKKIVLNYF